VTPGGRDPDETTERIRDAAVDELLAVGQADFAMESVARRAYFSIGTVYNRWPDRESLLADVGQERIAPHIVEQLAAAASPADAIDWALDAGRQTGLLAGEIMLAGHTTSALSPVAAEMWRSLHDGLAEHLPGGMAWYVATYAIGDALLGAVGVSGPQPATGRVQWFVDACDCSSSAPAPPREAAPVRDIDVPAVPSPQRSDEVARSLIEAARLLLAERGAAGTSTRDIAAGAGVTTGALYRRYDGKSGLLADVLLAQLQPDRYTWTWDLVQALASADPLSDAATVLARRMIDTAGDTSAQRVLLQVGIAARNDPALRAQVGERIRAAHDARADMARGFAEAGVLRRDVSPEVLAWGFQAIPVGVRATLPLGIALAADDVSASMGALLSAAAEPSA
jgi:AcrR family transcriptional regulator